MEAQMPFRIEIIPPNNHSFHLATTQDYQNYLSLVEKYGKNKVREFEGEKFTPANIFLTVTRETITWFISQTLDLDFTSQQWRNQLYSTAAKAHRKTDSGCVRYYRGTNSLHVKRQHITIEEASHNHNHYRFNNEVTPCMLEAHLTNFVEIDMCSTYGGSSKKGEPKFLDKEQKDDIVAAFASCYEEEHKKSIYTGLSRHDEFVESPYLKYTDEDIKELEQGVRLEGGCRDLAQKTSLTMLGIHAYKADQRQHCATSQKVIERRVTYQNRIRFLNEKMHNTERAILESSNLAL